MDRGYRHFGTTADVGAVSCGLTREDAFAGQSKAMFAVMTDLRYVRAANTYEVLAETDEAADDAGLLAAWLEELLYVSDVEGVYLRNFEIASIGSGRVTGKAYGEEMDPARHVVKAQVKAVTHHGISVTKTKAGYETRVIYDI